MKGLNLLIIRAPHGYREQSHVVAKLKKLGINTSDCSVYQVEDFLHNAIKEHSASGISNFMWKDSYWYMQQCAKRDFIAGIKRVVIVGEFPEDAYLLSLARTARTYHAKFTIETLDYPSSMDGHTSVPLDITSEYYDRNLIVLSVARFEPCSSEYELIELSKFSNNRR